MDAAMPLDFAWARLNQAMRDFPPLTYDEIVNGLGGIYPQAPPGGLNFANSLSQNTVSSGRVHTIDPRLAFADRQRIAELERSLHQARAQCAIEREVAERACETRDALARRCAEQARHIADLLAMNEEERSEPDPIHAAIAAHQRAGLR